MSHSHRPDPQHDELRDAPPGWTAGIVRVFLTSKMSVLLIIAALVAGAFALQFTPREEDPQIVVPVIDVHVAMPGASVQEIERLAAAPLETILKEIPGVENVYTFSRPGAMVCTVRFYVGEDREQSLTKVCVQLEANRHRVPPGLPGWQVMPVDIDDVPIVSLALYSCELSTADLRRVALELAQDLAQTPDVGKAAVIGGEQREIRVVLDPAKMAGYQLAPLEVAAIVQHQNLSVPAERTVRGREMTVYAGPFITSAEQLKQIVVGISNGRPVYLADVAEVYDGQAEATTYTRIGFGPAADSPAIGLTECPAVTIAIAKRKGANAVAVADRLLQRVASHKNGLIPGKVGVQVTRNYGETANHKVNELVMHLTIAVVTIIVLLGLALGWREAMVVALAVPITLAITLLCDLVFGYTINRVTLFALILSLGLLVDDPIVDVENIYRHFKLRKHPPLLATLVAVDEIRPPTILATFTVIVSFLPMFFITGMMGPYMAPMAFNVPTAMIMSLFVAFTITPWAAYYALRKEYDLPAPPFDLQASGLYRLYRGVMAPLLERRALRWLLLLAVFALFLGALALAGLGFVPLKMLPFDNKNELQLVIETPEGTPPEGTDAVVSALGDYLRSVPEVVAYTTYTGLASPTDFNGLVRHYFLRRGGNVADIRINLLPKEQRQWQSHAIALRVRPAIEEIGKRHNAIVKIVESPPGPPVLSSIVAEVYGPPGADYSQLVKVAQGVRETLAATPGVGDVDANIEDPAPRLDIVVDKEKASLAGVDFNAAVATAQLALAGQELGSIRDAADREAATIRLRLPYEQREDAAVLQEVRVRAGDGNLVALGELAGYRAGTEEQTIYHKDLRPVMYVTAEQVGVSPVNAMFDARKKLQVPEGYTVVWDGEGEWKITVEVFRDLGLAFAAAMLLIYFLLVAQTGSLLVPGVMMVAIPLTMIGIFPGFWLLNLFAAPVGSAPNPVFFTATGMIGMIALAGIVVRNSIILIDFIEMLKQQGRTLAEAIIEAGAVRTRPILLTAAAALFGAWVIVLDPIFSGLAWSFIFGIFASTLFTLIVIPLCYFMLVGRRGDEPQPSTEPPAGPPAGPRPLTAQERAAATAAAVADAEPATGAPANAAVSEPPVARSVPPAAETAVASADLSGAVVTPSVPPAPAVATASTDLPDAVVPPGVSSAPAVTASAGQAELAPVIVTFPVAAPPEPVAAVPEAVSPLTATGTADDTGLVSAIVAPKEEVPPPTAAAEALAIAAPAPAPEVRPISRMADFVGGEATGSIEPPAASVEVPAEKPAPVETAPAAPAAKLERLADAGAADPGERTIRLKVDQDLLRKLGGKPK